MKSAIASLIPQDKLPGGWEEKTLDEISLLKQYGYTCPASNVPKGPRLLRITDMNDDGAFIQEPKVYSDLSLKEAKKYLLEEGDILIARTGEPGKASIFKGEEPAIFASYLIRFRINPKIVSSRLVLYLLRTRNYFDQIIEKTSETTQKNVNATKLGQIKIPIPFPNDPKKSLELQHQIVTKLDKIYKLYKEIIDKHQNSIDFQLSQLPKAVLAKAFKGELT